MPKQSDISGKLIMSPDAKQLTPELAARIFFGMSLDRLVEDIKKNPGGKYDDLYIKD